MLTANEIYLLNESLDGSDIYGIDKELAIRENLSSKINVMDSLKEKKIVNEDNTINPLSYLLIKSLEKFKGAKSYLWVNDMVLSEDDSDYMVVMRKDNELEQFDMQKTSNFHFMFSLLKEYEFLKGDDGVKSIEVSSLPVNEFIEEYIIGCNDDEYLILRREMNGRIPYISDYVTYVCKNNEVFKYNVLKQELLTISGKRARVEISKLLRLEVDKNE